VIDTVFYKKIITYSIPFVVLLLFIVTIYKINIGLFVGIFLLIIAAKNYFVQLSNVSKFLTKYENFYLIVMGIVHGTTNLGGSLLTAIVHNKKYEKDVIRATVAASYATFAIFQIAFLSFSTHPPSISLGEIGLYLLIGVIVFILTESTVYTKINSKRYANFFSLLLFVSGLLLCFKSL
jgi:uncharacterized membrane protein YfcA